MTNKGLHGATLQWRAGGKYSERLMGLGSLYSALYGENLAFPMLGRYVKACGGSFETAASVLFLVAGFQEVSKPPVEIAIGAWVVSKKRQATAVETKKP